jgi:hypothetical protein
MPPALPARATLLVAAALPVLAAACASAGGRPAGAAATGAERAVVPALALNTSHLAEGTTRWRLTVTRDTARRDYGVMTVETRFVEHAGAPAVLTVRTVQTPRGAIVDSALALRRTLAPVWQRSHQPTKTMRLDFAASAVTGTVTPKDSATRAVNHPTGVPVFDATDLGAVIASLPYAEGYATTLPFYTFELGGMETDSVRVLGAERAATPGGAPREAWKVAFSDPFITATFWVDRETRRILRQDTVQRRTGILFRMEPIA